MATIQELREMAARQTPGGLPQAAPVVVTAPPEAVAPAADPVVAATPFVNNGTPLQEPELNPAVAPVDRSKIRVFKHPVAGSTVIMADGTVLEFVGPITGSGPTRMVGEGLIETDDPKQIEILVGIAKSKTSMVTEVVLSPVTGSVAPRVVKPADPALAAAVVDATKNTQVAANPEQEKQFVTALVAGTAKDTDGGKNPLPVDTSVQTALAASLAAGDQSKPGTEHNLESK